MALPDLQSCACVEKYGHGRGERFQLHIQQLGFLQGIAIGEETCAGNSEITIPEYAMREVADFHSAPPD